MDDERYDTGDEVWFISEYRLEKGRILNTKPTLSLEKYAGRYDSKLYGSLAIEHKAGQLFVIFGEYTTDISHWQDESFYVRTPNRLTFDWLLTFEHLDDGKVSGVTIKYLGWDKDEKDGLFARSSLHAESRDEY